MNTFSADLLDWYDKHGRKDLPWQQPRSAYRVWISEIMLQQTQVKTVIPYFNRFMARFPDLATLAAASEDEVLSHWSGLGYYSRARYLQQTANIIVQTFNGIFPSDVAALEKLPGIGPSTAAAIASIAFEKSEAILDGNVIRVLARYFKVAGSPTLSAVKKELWRLAKSCMPLHRCADYTQAIMDLGATCCTLKNPTCEICPLQKTCLAQQERCVNEYPYKKPKKSIPTKQEQFLLLHNESGAIYLEKRPSAGLWGGLWCLPSIEMNVCAITFVEKKYPVRIDTLVSLETIKHSFSHFHLHIKPLSIGVNYLSQLTCPEPSGKWVKPSALHTLGLAKPISQVIALHFNALASE